MTAAVTAAVLCLVPAAAHAHPAAAFQFENAPAGVALPPGLAASDMSPLAVSDIDRDGDADLVALADDRTWHVWLNQGDGRFEHAAASVEPATLWGSADYISASRTHGRSIAARLEGATKPSHGPPGTTQLVTIHLVLSEPATVSPLTFEPGSPRSPPAFVG